MENKLVFKGENGQVLTDSIRVAKTFSKEHKRVMQDIRELTCSDEFRRHNFVQSSYFNNQNKEQPMYIMTEDGFTFLAMGYTGEKASKFKEEYIKQFNDMKKELDNENKIKFHIPQTLSEALYLDKYTNKIKPIILKEVEPLISKGSGQKRKRVLCKCGYCGKEFIAHKYSITSGKTKSCGCLQIYATKKKFTIHGDSFSRLNNIFRAMKRRCYNKHCKDYKNYGGRGIKVEFNGYAEFKKWADNNGYNENLTIERRDVNKNYNKENCTWIKNEDQSLNKTNTIYVNYKGNRIALCLLCRNKKLNYHAVWRRIYIQHKSLSDSLY